MTIPMEQSATKEDIAALSEEMKRLEGKIERLAEKIEIEAIRQDGKLYQLELYLKVLIGLAVLAMIFFSPYAHIRLAGLMLAGVVIVTAMVKALEI